MTEVLDDPIPQKPTDTKRIIEQVENCRTGLLREVLDLRKIICTNAFQEGEIYREIDKSLKTLKKLYMLSFVTIIGFYIMLSILIFFLMDIRSKLTNLGL